MGFNSVFKGLNSEFARTDTYVQNLHISLCSVTTKSFYVTLF